jgi:hypothetical protein
MMQQNYTIKHELIKLFNQMIKPGSIERRLPVKRMDCLVTGLRPQARVNQPFKGPLVAKILIIKTDESEVYSYC